MAIFELAPTEQRGIVDQCQALLSRGEEWDHQQAARQLLWNCLVSRHTQGDIIVRGRPQGALELIDVQTGLLQGARPDYERDSVDLGGLIIHNLRIFEPAQKSSVEMAGSRPKPLTKTGVTPQWDEQAGKAWFQARLKDYPSQTGWYSLAEDWAAAKAEFGQVPRRTIELLREEIVRLRIRPGRPSEKTP